MDGPKLILGPALCNSDGADEGDCEGGTDGTTLYCSDGDMDGTKLILGPALCNSDGADEGACEGGTGGTPRCCSDGDTEGAWLGEAVGHTPNVCCFSWANSPPSATSAPSYRTL